MAQAILTARLRVPAHVMQRAFAEQTILLNLETGQYHALTGSGGRLLELIVAGDGSVEGAVAALAQETGTTADAIASDAAEFFSALADRGLVDVDGGA